MIWHILSVYPTSRAFGKQFMHFASTLRKTYIETALCFLQGRGRYLSQIQVTWECKGVNSPRKRCSSNGGWVTGKVPQPPSSGGTLLLCFLPSASRTAPQLPTVLTSSLVHLCCPFSLPCLILPRPFLLLLGITCQIHYLDLCLSLWFGFWRESN